MAPRTSLRGKLLRATLLVLGTTAVATLFFVGLLGVQSSRRALEETEALLERSLHDKGRLLADNHAIALRNLVDDNAFGDVKAVVERAVTDDDEVVYGAFVDADGRVWAYAHGDGAVADPGVATEELGLAEASRPSVRRFGHHTVAEMTADVAIEGESLGTLHYGLSKARLEQALAHTRAEHQLRLFESLALIVLAVGVSGAMGLAFMTRLSGRITEPLRVLGEAAAQLAAGDRTVKVQLDSGDELEQLGGTFNQMVGDIDSTYRELEELNASLEQRVEERTEALAQRTEDIARILAHIDQGILTVDADLRIDDEHSAHLAAILGTERIAGRSVVELLLDRLEIEESERSAALTVLQTSVGSMALLFPCNAHLLPSDVPFRAEDGTERQLEIDWIALPDDDGFVGSIMVTLRDVTELRRLQSEAASHGLALSRMGELLSSSADDIDRFLATSDSLLGQIQDVLEAGSEAVSRRVDELFRSAHTLKGVAGQLGLGGVQQAVHAQEERLRSLRDDDEVPDLEALRRDQTQVVDVVRAYRALYQERLRGFASGAAAASAPEYADDTVGAVVAQASKGLDDLASKLGKLPPRTVVVGGSIGLDADIATALSHALVHAVRNSVDHGLESPEERRAHGKAARGEIVVHARHEADHVVIDVHDDGRGLALTALRGDEVGWSAERAAASIFSAGVSTAQSVTEVSGRGVGMEAVRAFLRARGGDATVILEDPQTDAAFAPFRLRLTVPAPSRALGVGA
jgi:HAMP domain-containing protein/HPt (histidine-containing phosphotransfer) domain-containing protein